MFTLQSMTSKASGLPPAHAVSAVSGEVQCNDGRSGNSHNDERRKSRKRKQCFAQQSLLKSKSGKKKLKTKSKRR